MKNKRFMWVIVKKNKALLSIWENVQEQILYCTSSYETPWRWAEGLAGAPSPTRGIIVKSRTKRTLPGISAAALEAQNLCSGKFWANWCFTYNLEQKILNWSRCFIILWQWRDSWAKPVSDWVTLESKTDVTEVILLETRFYNMLADLSLHNRVKTKGSKASGLLK